MRRGRVATMVLALAVAWTAAGVAQQTAEQRFQAALYQEEVQGNLQRAIALYEGILKDHAANRAVAARAQLHIGLCYETLGLTEAQRAYQRVIDEFADQSEAAGQARARLAALQAPAPVEGRGPVARRLLSGDDTDISNLLTMMPSPDGRRAAYVDLQQGRVYLRDLASGAVEQLQSGLPAVWNWSPIWSSDGTRLAFQVTSLEDTTESIKILDLASRTVVAIPGTHVYTGGQGKSLTPVGWSPDGHFLLFRTESNNNPGPLGIMPVNGGARTVLADSVAPLTRDRVLTVGGSFSPDGRYVTYAAGEKGSEQVFVQPTSGGARRQITDTPGGNFSPLWSPDGRAIAYQRPEGIWVVPVAQGAVAGAPRLAYANAVPRTPFAWTEAGGLYLTLYNDALIPYQVAVDSATGVPSGVAEELPHHPASATAAFGLQNYFAWSPDRERIAFAGWTLGRQVAVYAADGNATVSHTVAEPEERISGVRWSGDGRAILYHSQRGEGRTLMALDPTSGQVRELFPRSVSQWPLSVSDDGGVTLSLYGQSRTDPTHGLIITETGRSGHRLVAPAFDSGGVSLGVFACLSPQGDKVFFTRQARAGYTDAAPDAATLWVVDSDGDGARKLSAAAVITSGVADPSGRFVAYTGWVNSTTHVLRIVEVATGVTRNVELPARSSDVTVTDWSRDGKFVGFVARQSRWEYWVVQGLLESGR